MLSRRIQFARFLSNVLDLVLYVKVKRFIRECNCDTTGRLLLHKIDKKKYCEFFELLTVGSKPKVREPELGLVKFEFCIESGFFSLLF